MKTTKIHSRRLSKSNHKKAPVVTKNKLHQQEKLISDLELKLVKLNQEVRTLKKEKQEAQLHLNDFLELLNERKRVPRLTRVLKNGIKFFIQPIQRTRLIYEKKLVRKHNAFHDYYYLYHNRDLLLGRVDPLEHFLNCGWKEGRSPNPEFNIAHEMNRLSNVVDQTRNPLVTRLREQERTYNVLKKSKLFDADFYKKTYEDLANLELDPIEHYMLYGANEGRNPSPSFNTSFYFEKYPDIKNARVNPLWHYIEYGQYEDRLPYEGFERKGKTNLKYKLKKLWYVKKTANINLDDLFAFIKRSGIKGAFNKIDTVLKENGAVIHKLIQKYNYQVPTLTDQVLEDMDTFKMKPKFSIIMPVYNVDPKWLDQAIQSIKTQWYTNWELCMCDDRSNNPKTIHYLKQIDDPQIKVLFSEKNLNISGASNLALEQATGDYVVLMDHDDEITVDALYEVAKEINRSGAEFIYSDEDKLELNGRLTGPHFKPDYSPDMILSQNYMSHLGVIKRELVEKVGGFTIGLEGAQDHDLYLKVLEETNQVAHISKVLYHWRKIPGSTASEFSDKSYAQEAGRRAVELALKRRKIDAVVANGKYPGTFKVDYVLQGEPLISIIIPFKDKPDLLKMCVESILEKSTYTHYEIIGVSNNSEEKATFVEMERLSALDSRVRFSEYNVPFNFSKINNFAVKHLAKGEQILMLNNDIEIISEDWLERLLEYSQREEVGAVGAKLYYPNNMVQHAGVIVGLGGVAGHSHKYFSRKDPGFFFRPHLVQNLSAVTAACLMVKKSLYEEIGGLNEENLTVAFNDIDFCLRLRERGLLNVYTPYAEAYHHESISRGQEDSPEKILRFQNEVYYMQDRHKEILAKGDPYYNRNLSLDSEDFSLNPQVL